jgi:hypothetical protein
MGVSQLSRGSTTFEFKDAVERSGGQELGTCECWVWLQAARSKAKENGLSFTPSLSELPGELSRFWLAIN